MRYLKTFIISIFIIVFFSIAQGVFAQDETNRTDFNKNYIDYRDKYEDYVTQHEKYFLSKRQYEQYKTLSAKEQLQKDLSEMLIDRDGVLNLYYKTLVSKLKDKTIDIPEDKRNEYISKLESEITWISDHITLYYATDTPEILSDKSEEVDKRNKDFIGEIYRSLYYISRGKIVTYNARFNYLFNEFYSLTEKIKIEQREAYKLSDSKIEIINRWFGEINLKDQEFNKLLEQAEVQIMKNKGKAVAASYGGAEKILSQAKEILIQEIANLKEIATQIKVAED